MAYMTHTPAQTALRSVAASLATLWTGFGEFLVRLGESSSRAHQIQALQNMTDRELADRFGISRDQIAAYVFRDTYHV